ncbi:putative signal peptidase II [Tannerella forsythia KS16]|jgi:signal peptidase II|uniref:Lipoprotein signal peptidase n=2 Tax=Tannerella forsythia TaxID=28112 RepID=G8UPA1_TANFA|nr:lipoprotein signal peptidase [Tannerella forsythia]AEW22122.1 putative signal peptidase II [Tannerella forsythia 92A2]KKY60399.1 peptidase A8 [Tannerella forsythia]PDP43510.1 lipoprotein signal peptidase [Tannerella forsythia]PDP71850.1 lipoprotein signal peptidase [Tannerella forsythia]TPE18173.1 lipoprotein signal peptidase [Tannerella forsythia]
MKGKKAWGAATVILLLLFLDQASKIWVKTHMQLHESLEIFSWFQLYFTENPGMAFGMEFLNKLVLSVFRIAAVVAIAYYLIRLVRRNYSFGFIACVALVFAGALGNIIDSVFYGVIFDHSYGQIATFMPAGGGYASLLHGKVVDMLYFPLIRTTLPDWLPIWGGEEFIFFRPIFNLADSSICVGGALLLLFYHRTLSKSLSRK